MTRTRIVVLVALGIGAVAWIVSMLVETDEERIEARIEAMTAAAVNRDVDGILEGLASGFEADGALSGTADRDRVRSLLERSIGSGDLVVLSSSIESVEVTGDTATALVFVKFEAKSLGGRAVADRWKVGFERTEKGWLVASATRRPLGR